MSSQCKLHSALRRGKEQVKGHNLQCQGEVVLISYCLLQYTFRL